MPITKLLACAGSVIVDKTTNSLSLVEIIETIETPGFPVAVPRLAIVWVKSKEDKDQEKSDYVLEIDITGAERRAYPMHVDFQGQSMHRSIVMLAGLGLPSPGEIVIRVKSAEGTGRRPLAILAIPVTAVASPDFVAAAALPPAPGKRKLPTRKAR